MRRCGREQPIEGEGERIQLKNQKPKFSLLCFEIRSSEALVGWHLNLHIISKIHYIVQFRRSLLPVSSLAHTLPIPSRFGSIHLQNAWYSLTRHHANRRATFHFHRPHSHKQWHWICLFEDSLILQCPSAIGPLRRNRTHTSHQCWIKFAHKNQFLVDFLYHLVRCCVRRLSIHRTNQIESKLFKKKTKHTNVAAVASERATFVEWERSFASIFFFYFCQALCVFAFTFQLILFVILPLHATISPTKHTTDTRAQAQEKK